MVSLGNRIVVLIDMDCFFCQVETKLRPEYAGKPLAVVQYNLWGSGGIIAVNYEAREFGVTRHMRSEEAKEKCPEIILATVPPLRGKADTSRYRSAGREVIDVLKKHCSIVERASVDEAYLDITQIVDEKLAKENIESSDLFTELSTTYIVGHSEVGVNNEEKREEGLKTWLSEASEDPQIQRLAIAGSLVELIRKDIFEVTGFKCSAGISFNKILAKLACGLHKPNRQTILPASSVPDLFGALPVKQVRHLGGKLGDIVIDLLKCNVMADLLPFSLQQLQNNFDEKTGLWLYNIARGIDNEPVTSRLVSKSLGACKRFPGKQAIVDIEVLKHWLGELSAEVCERLEQDQDENERRASLLTFSYHFFQNNILVCQSKSLALTSYKPERMAEQCLNIVVKATQLKSIGFLGLSAGKFIRARGSESFVNFFKTGASNDNSICTATTNTVTENNVIEDLKADKDVQGTYQNVNSERSNDTEAIHKSIFGKETESKSVKPVTPVSKPKPNRRKSSPCSSIQKSLKSDNFKKSFFMKILKEKRPEVEVAVVKTDSPESDHQNTDSLQTSGEFIESPDMFADNDEDDDDVCFLESRPSTSKKPEFQSVQSEQQNSCNSGGAIDLLKEMFPDLNNIDVEIVKMLPPNLQQEARKYLRASKDTDKSSEVKKVVKNKETSSSKISKEKSSKSKNSNFKPKNIQKFFIKTDSRNDSNDNFKKCTECDQLILVGKFNEHTDYHMAINLQREINQTSVDENRKRKGSVDSSNQLKKRVSEEIATTS
ncbi:DNA polymerase eta [Copidosoma floridanum]|uniref:DNA polymerase eta n=1 Tax=Copidosoma floridanum TaxID=29053 RepID=UPI0006C96D46|nr:DNA polymerase eta [Copidosoma floridanum]